MTCRHEDGDPACSSYPAWKARQEVRAEEERLIALGKSFEERKEELLARTPDPDDFRVSRFEEVGDWLVVEVQYSNCSKCNFDARKIMVFRHASAQDLVNWRRIDPHFAKTSPEMRDIRAAPPPRARFPGDDEGWHDAIEYAEGKCGPDPKY